MIKDIIHVFKTNKYAKIAIVVAILMPAIFGGIFLGSMWDPYGNSKNMPVAVVNYDKPVEFKGNTLDIGSKLVDQLKDNDSLDFQVTTKKKAEEGLRKGDYYMMITIPKDFSKNAATLLDKDPKKMKLEYETNPGTNFLGSMVTTSAVTNIKTAVQEQVTKQYSDALFKVIDNLSDGLEKADNGSKKLTKGVGNLENGYKTMSEKTKKLKSGSKQLTDGTKNLKNGAQKLNQGVLNLNNGTDQLMSGLTNLYSGNGKLQKGVQNLTTGEKNLKTGVDAYVSGVEKVYTGVSGMVTKNATIQENMDKLNKNVTTLEKGSSQLDENVEQMQNMVASSMSLEKVNAMETEVSKISELEEKIDVFSKSYDSMSEDERAKALNEIKQSSESTLGQAKGMISDFKDSATKMNTGITKLRTGTKNLKTGTESMISGIRGEDGTSKTSGLIFGINSYLQGAQTLKTNVEKLYGKSTTLTNGTKNLETGVNKLSKNSKKLDSGVQKLKPGSKKLQIGVKTLVSNSKKLSDGTNNLETGTNNMSLGIVKLVNGMGNMDQGITKLKTGTNKLNKNLEKGIDEANQNLKYVSDDTNDMVASPVKASGSEMTSVDNMGNSMAAFLLSVGIWVGAMTFCMMYPIQEWTKSAKNGIQEWLSKAIVFLPVSALWGVAIIPLINLFLDIKPNNMSHTLLVAVIGAMTFVSIVYFINLLAGKPATGIILILLVLQLSSAGGIFPMEMTSKFYQVVHPFMPFTYTVNAFRSTIANGNSIVFPCAVLIGIAVCMNLLSMMLLQKRHKSQIIYKESVMV